MKDFKTFYHGPMRPLLEDFFPTLLHYTPIMKCFSKIWIKLKNALCFKAPNGNFIVDSTPIKLCLHARIKRFKAMREAMEMAVSSTKTIFGFKVHITTNAEGTTAINSCFSNGSAHDVCFFGDVA